VANATGADTVPTLKLLEWMARFSTFYVLCYSRGDSPAATGTVPTSKLLEWTASLLLATHFIARVAGIAPLLVR